VSACPEAVAPRVLVRPTLAVADVFTETVAMTPFGIFVAIMPYSTHA